MTLTAPIKRGFSFWPFIILPRWLKKNSADRIAYLVHEQTHYDRQGIGVLWWILKWYFSKKFRWQEESLAYKNQMLSLRTLRQTVNAEYFISEMTNGYRGMCSKAEATAFVNGVLDGHQV